MRLEHPKAGKIQQGAVLNCISVQGYDDCECHGISSQSDYNKTRAR
jgi:hypothetical protein